ncbi:hypothetical protein LCGC14_2867310 [marine sediment metagenome]|uniref:DNA cytosine methyltransferase n=1 Tax=marine sediment metagenome TaxID=412755 RepID=A0A0F8Y3T1_9ZZZZ
MNVLVACEFSGRVRDAFRAKGHDAWSCDLLPTELPGSHHQGPLEDWISSGREWDLIVAHPPCTYLCNSGVRWLHEQSGRFELMERAAYFFNMIMARDCPKIAIENPIMHKYAVEIVGRRQDQIIQPWQHGHGETKATCFWLKGLPLLKPTNIVTGRENRIHKMAPSKDRGHLRSITYQGIADAMAEQWG